jgi:hypothetical protein
MFGVSPPITDGQMVVNFTYVRRHVWALARPARSNDDSSASYCSLHVRWSFNNSSFLW